MNAPSADQLTSGGVTPLFSSPAVAQPLQINVLLVPSREWTNTEEPSQTATAFPSGDTRRGRSLVEALPSWERCRPLESGTRTATGDRRRRRARRRPDRT